VLPICLSPRLLTKPVRNIASPSWMNTFVPCHSSTSKSASKIVRQRVPRGYVPSHLCLQALKVVLQSARHEGEAVVSRAPRCAGCATLIGDHGTTDTAALRPVPDARVHEGTINDQRPAAIE
jgi:hypothetical protein